MSGNFIFGTTLKWTGDKRGELYSSEKPQLQISTPPEFKGPDGYWSPEELFLASINSCIMTTFLYFTEKFSLSFFSYESEIEGGVGFEGGKLVFSSVVVRPVIMVKSKSEKEKARQAIEKSEEYCLISGSVKSKITVLPRVEIK